MYEVSRFVVPEEVKAFQDDDNSRGDEWDGAAWHVTGGWVPVFHQHKSILEPIAESGNAWAQYSMASIYMLSLLHSSEMSAIKASDDDSKECTRWLLMAARQGFLPALDNLLTSGVGSEVDRIRALSKTIPRSPDLDSGDVDLMEKAKIETMKELYRLAFSCDE